MRSAVMSSSSVAMRGIAALVLGLIALLLPGPALFALVFLFGAYALVDGILSLVAAAKENAEYGRGWLVLEGVAGIVVGLGNIGLARNYSCRADLPGRGMGDRDRYLRVCRGYSSTQVHTA